METLFSALTFEMPSIVTSLVAFRPPLMKGDEPGAGMTPGLRVAADCSATVTRRVQQDYHHTVQVPLGHQMIMIDQRLYRSRYTSR